MKWMLPVIVALGAAACTPEAPTTPAPESQPPALEAPALPIADQAGNRLEAMSAIGERWCQTDGGGWCVNSQRDGLVADFRGRSVSIVLDVDENVSVAPWSNIITSGDKAFVGAIVSESQMYSGGSARVDQLVLYEVSDGAAREALRLPYASDVSIRACFDEEDMQARLEACHDQYSFVSRVRIDDAVTSGDPHIVLETAAGTFPGRASRTDDSAERGALTAADLVWLRDDVCSYRRTFARGRTGAYAPDTELPACADYLEP